MIKILKSKLFKAILIIAVLTAAYYAYTMLNNTPEQLEYLTLRKTNVVSTITSTGKVTSDIVTLKSQISGVINNTNTKEGMRFRKGDILLRFDDTEYIKELEKSKSSLQSAYNNLNIIQQRDVPMTFESLVQAELSYKRAQDQYHKINGLFEENAVSQQDLDSAKYELDISLSRLNNEINKNKTLSSEGIILKDANNKIEQATLAVDSAEIKYAKTKVIAPFSGIIIKKFKNAGEWCNIGEPLLDIMIGDRLFVKAEIDEKFLPQISLGQSVLIKPEAFVNTLIDGTIESISPSVNVRNGTIEITINMIAAPKYLKNDMTVNIEIITGKKNDVLVLDKKYLGGDDGRTIWALENGEVVIKSIEIEEDLKDRVIVSSILVENDIILLPDRYSLGQKINPAELR